VFLGPNTKTYSKESDFLLDCPSFIGLTNNDTAATLCFTNTDGTIRITTC